MSYTYIYTLETKLYIHVPLINIWYDTIHDIKSLQQQCRATNGGAVKFSGSDGKPPHQIEHLHVIIITCHACTYTYMEFFWFFWPYSRYQTTARKYKDDEAMTTL